MAFPTPEEAEEAFYTAMRDGDLAAMRSVWAEHDGIVCVHPGGQPMLGYTAVMNGWERVLSGHALQVEADVLSASMGSNIAVHVVSEQVRDLRGRPLASLIATNVYEWSEEGWSMLLHHVSQELLENSESRLLH